MKKKLIVLILCMSLTSMFSMSFAGDPIEPVMNCIQVSHDLLVESNQK